MEATKINWKISKETMTSQVVDPQSKSGRVLGERKEEHFFENREESQ